MRRLITSAVLTVFCSLTLTQAQTAAPRGQADGHATRDLNLERDALAQREKIDAMLPPWAKPRLDAARKAFLRRLRSEGDGADLSRIVRQEVEKQFKGLTPQQSHILTFHVSAGVIELLPPHSVEGGDSEAEREKPKGWKDGSDEMSRQDMLVLQQLMEKKGKLETMISNSMKAGFEGGEAAIQALRAS